MQSLYKTKYKIIEDVHEVFFQKHGYLTYDNHTLIYYDYHDFKKFTIRLEDCKIHLIKSNKNLIIINYFVIDHEPEIAEIQSLILTLDGEKIDTDINFTTLIDSSDKLGFIVQNYDPLKRLPIFSLISNELNHIWSTESNYSASVHFDEYILFSNSKTIGKIDEGNGSIKWEFNLIDLPPLKFNNENQNEAYVLKLLGISNEKVFILISNDKILSLSLHSGKICDLIEEEPFYIQGQRKEIFKNSIQLDKLNNEIVQLDSCILTKINLATKEIKSDMVNELYENILLPMRDFVFSKNFLFFKIILDVKIGIINRRSCNLEYCFNLVPSKRFFKPVAPNILHFSNDKLYIHDTHNQIQVFNFKAEENKNILPNEKKSNFLKIFSIISILIFVIRITYLISNYNNKNHSQIQSNYDSSVVGSYGITMEFLKGVDSEMATKVQLSAHDAKLPVYSIPLNKLVNTHLELRNKYAKNEKAQRVGFYLSYAHALKDSKDNSTLLHYIEKERYAIYAWEEMILMGVNDSIRKDLNVLSSVTEYIKQGISADDAVQKSLNLSK
ncbi:MAG: hypothetical protein IPM42_08795 [Saprospiraceae bacterium]|nr:hypothetical protein [Saprospiraceae bacterium]